MTAKSASAAPSRQDYSFYTSAEYYKALKERIDRAKAGERIVLVTLWLRAEQPATAELIESLCRAAKRGVRILLLIDAFHYLIRQGTIVGPMFYFGPNRWPSWLIMPLFRKRKRAVDTLCAAGARVTIINQPKRALASPFLGRSHIKFSVIGNEVFIGGCNLEDPNSIDVMVGWQDRKIADWLTTFAEDVAREGRVSSALHGQDQQLAVDSKTHLLVDAGTVRQSIIMDTAHDMIAAADGRLLITYQYFPHGPTAEHLIAASQRGVVLQAFYNHPSQHLFPLNVIYRSGALPARRSGVPALSEQRLSRQHTYLHAKVILSDGRALVSSHNYMSNGVTWGTAEIGLQSDDPAFAEDVRAALRRQLPEVAE